MFARTPFMLYKWVVEPPRTQSDYAHGLRQIPLDVPYENTLRKGNDMTSRNMKYER